MKEKEVRPIDKKHKEEEVSEYYFSNPDPYFKIEPRPDGVPRCDYSFDEKGNIVVKNLSPFGCLM